MMERGLKDKSASTQQSVVEVGRLLGVDAILTGSISLSIGEISPAPEQTRRVATGVAVARLIDAEAGKVIWAKRVETDYSILTELYGDLGTWQTDHEIVQKVVSDLAGRIARYFYPHYERL
jgi:TolB-like protein